MSDTRNDSERLLAHEYDGIREYDNPTPGWWHVIFFVTIVYSFFYFLYYHANAEAPTIHSTWHAARVAETQRVFGKEGNLDGDEATIQRMRGRTDLLEVAQGLFIGNCSQCHGRDGGGMTGSGVDLTDDFYRNVRSVEDIFAVITNGAAGQQMPAWENRLSQNERVILAAYVANLRGTTPANPQGPAGDRIDPWPTPPTPPAPAAPRPD